MQSNWIKSLLYAASPLVANLPQSVTNGPTLLGTLDAPQLPTVANTWQRRSVFSDFHMFKRARHLKYDFTITREHRSPDGLNRSLILVNGQFPGPTIEANLGDTISVTVKNEIDEPKEGTSIHWHGIPHSGTPEYDGVPFLQQCPIAPGQSFEYTFKAEVAGTTMYHAHYSAQYMDGLYGALIIHGPKKADYDIDIGPVFLTDYSHTDYFGYLSRVYDIPPTFLPIENNLINGKMSYNCSLETKGRACTEEAGLAKFTLQKGKRHLLRLINAGGSATQKFSIDNHKLSVVANDFVPVEPYTVNIATVGVGQRTDVIVVGTGEDTDTAWMRSDIDVFCANATVFQHNALAAVYYSEADKEARPKSEAHAWDSMDCVNDPLEKTVPVKKWTPPEPSLTQNVDITAAPNGTGHLVFFVNDSNFRANYTANILLEASNGVTTFPAHPEYNVYDYTKETSVRLIIRNMFPVMHNMHLHGHSEFWILAEGMGEWDGKIVNPENPQRRDGAQLRMGWPEHPSYVVIQFNTDNPGVWPLHCHLVVHASAGLYVNIIEKADQLDSGKIERATRQTCEPWKEFEKNHPVDQIDSGLKMRALVDRSYGIN